MLITTNPQPTLWEAVLPPGYQELPRELAAVDALLDDPVFFEPYRAHFSEEFGRPSIPMETYLRMMFLKHRYGLGYETLCREVADSLSWSRFARVSLGARVPHPSTLGKITARCGPETIAQLNAALLAKAHAAKVVRTDKLRADTTVLAANVAYPTDSGLLPRHHNDHGVGRSHPRRRRGQPHQGPRPPPRRGGGGPGRSRRISSCAMTRPRPECSRSPGSWPIWPIWPNSPRPKRRKCWSTPAAAWPARAAPPPGDCPRRWPSSRSSSVAPSKWWPRPAPGSPG